MPVKKDASGRRSVEAEVEVPGTPEQVWQAIATGPGISSWFVPSDVEERDGGKAVSQFAPDGSMDSVGKVTTWSPPHRFVVETQEGAGTVATEWTVEARAGGTCVVRVVHNWFASTDDWDDQMEGHTHGWPLFFRILRLYLAHFQGQHGVSFQLMATAPEPTLTAWNALTNHWGLPVRRSAAASARHQERLPSPASCIRSAHGRSGRSCWCKPKRPAAASRISFRCRWAARCFSPGACICSARTRLQRPRTHSRCGRNGSASGLPAWAGEERKLLPAKLVRRAPHNQMKSLLLISPTETPTSVICRGPM